MAAVGPHHLAVIVTGWIPSPIVVCQPSRYAREYRILRTQRHSGLQDGVIFTDCCDFVGSFCSFLFRTRICIFVAYKLTASTVGAGHEGVIVSGVREGHVSAEFERAVNLVSRCVDNQRGSQVCR
jgi:hypothetical protein